MSNNKPPQKPSNNPNSTPNNKPPQRPAIKPQMMFQSQDAQPQYKMKNAPARTGSNSQGFITQSQAGIVTNELSPKKP